MILKLVRKNVTKKKLRSLLIVLTLLMTTAIIFVTVGATNLTENVVREMSRKYVGNTDIKVYNNDHAEYSSFQQIESEEYAFTVGFVDQECQYQKNNIMTLRGTVLSDLKKVWNLDLSDVIKEEDFRGNQAIIGQSIANKYGIKSGDTIEVKVGEINEKLKVAAIVRDKGIFINDGTGEYIIVPRAYLQRRLGYGNRINLELIHLKNNDNIKRAIEDIEEQYKYLDADYSYDENNISTMVNAQTNSYKLISIIVVLLDIIIISSIFKVISCERIPDIACIRSLGATGKLGECIILFEALFYSVIASFLGCVIGVAAMYKVAEISMPDYLVNLGVKVHFTTVQFILPICMTILVAIAGAYIPCKKVAKRSIKNLLFSIEPIVSKKKGSLKVVLALILIGVAICFPRKYITQNEMVIEVLFIVSLVLGFLLLTEYIVLLLGNILKKITGAGKGNVVYLAGCNTIKDRHILSNIRLLTVSLACFMLAYSVINSVVNNTVDLYRDNAKYDVAVWSTNDKAEISQIENACYATDGVKSIYTSEFCYGNEIKGTEFKFEKIQSVDVSKYNNFWYMTTSDGADPQQLLEKLDKERGIIVTSVMLDRLDKNVGDKIDIMFHGTAVPYRIVGTCESLNSSGNNAFISEKFFNQDVEKDFYYNTAVFVNGDAQKVVDTLSEKLKGKILFVETMDEKERENYEAYRGNYSMLKILTVIILALCIVGMTNNQIINFIQRKKFLCIHRSIGMSKKQLTLLLLTEAASSGIYGAVIAVALGNLLIYIMPYFFKASGQVIEISYSIPISLFCIVLGFILSILTVVILAVKNFNMSIIESIKYE